MGVLADAKPAIIICTRDRVRAAAFYRDTLGLKLLSRTNSLWCSTSPALLDKLGIWAAPDATVRVAWFKDPDGNVPSVTNA
jgi:hypothetical protein